jgi:hypothetical protein
VAEDTASELLRYDQVIAEALQRNPELKAATEEWRAAKLRIPQASISTPSESRFSHDTACPRNSYGREVWNSGSIA